MREGIRWGWVKGMDFDKGGGPGRGGGLHNPPIFVI